MHWTLSRRVRLTIFLFHLRDILLFNCPKPIEFVFFVISLAQFCLIVYKKTPRLSPRLRSRRLLTSSLGSFPCSHGLSSTTVCSVSLSIYTSLRLWLTRIARLDYSLSASLPVLSACFYTTTSSPPATRYIHSNTYFDRYIRA